MSLAGQPINGAALNSGRSSTQYGSGSIAIGSATLRIVRFTDFPTLVATADLTGNGRITSITPGAFVATAYMEAAGLLSKYGEVNAVVVSTMVGDGYVYVPDITVFDRSEEIRLFDRPTEVRLFERSEELRVFDRPTDPRIFIRPTT